MAEWNTCEDPSRLLGTISGQISARKLRLLLVAYWRSVWSHLRDPRLRRAVEIAESFADGIASEADLQQAGVEAEAASRECRTGPKALQEYMLRVAVASITHCWAGQMFDEAVRLISVLPPIGISLEAMNRKKAALIRELFTPPKLMVRNHGLIARTANASQIAKAIYTERRFTDMPILADALEEAGEAHSEMLEHCRSVEEHFRGCWLIDGLLGKE